MLKNTNFPPIKDGVTADNTTYSSNKIEELVAEAGKSELPSVTSADEGKVLTVGSDGSWKAAPVPNELPAVTNADNTKILRVYEGKWVKQSSINIGKYMFVTNWGGDPVVTGLTLDEFNTMVSTPNGIAQCGYSGPEISSPQVVLLPTGYVGTSIINFTGYEITSTGTVKYLLTLSTTGSGDSRKFICALKKFTMTADT